MQISVTKQDIQEGVRWTISLCPLARAIRRAFKAPFVVVGADGCVQVGEFDRSARGAELEAVAPFTFTLEQPAPQTRGLFDEV